MKLGQGTPKTLNGAIQNAFQDYKDGKSFTEQRLRKILKQHVQDFIRNKISPAYMAADERVSKELDKFLKAIK